MRDHFIARLSEMALRDSRVMLVTGDLGFGVFNEYRERFARQFINVGVAEQNMIGVATGLALEGFIVYTYSIANFAFMRCLEQIRNDAAYHQANVNVVCIGGGFSYGALGISHHATEDLAIMRSLPDVTVVSPCDTWETVEATEALANTPGVSYLRLDKSAAPESHGPDDRFQLGKIRTLREGTDLTLVGTGGIMQEILGAADVLQQRGIDCRILSAHTLKPLDEPTILRAANETGGVITVEEHSLHGGLGSAVAETLMDSGVMPGCFRRLALRQGFSSVVGSQHYLRRCYGLDQQAIVAQAIEALQSKVARSSAEKYRRAA